jgi:hypothetical protein
MAKNPHMLAAWQKNAVDAYQHHFAKKIVMDAWNAALRDELQRGLQTTSSAVTGISEPDTKTRSRAVTAT